jgi:acyl-CoA reductase-like NAD-dependent aldehyde dehydrogenase
LCDIFFYFRRNLLKSVKNFQNFDAAVASGAQLMTGGKRINAVSYAPTVLLNPANDSNVSTQEVFSPVVCIIVYKTP